MVGDPVDERRHETGLADPTDAEHGEELASLIRERSVEHVPQERELAFAADDRRVQVTCEPSRAGRHLDQPVGRHRMGLALEDEVCDRLGRDRVTHERERPLPEQDLARCRGLFQAGRDVHRVARHDLLVADTSDDVTGVDSDPARERHPVVTFELRVQRREGSAHLARGTDGPQRVVLMNLRHAEDGHDGVADELLDGAPVMFDRRLHRLEEAFHDTADRLRIERLTHRGRARDVAEHDRDRLADLERSRSRSQGGRAFLTELRAVPILVSAHLAPLHRRSLTANDPLGARERPLGWAA